MMNVSNGQLGEISLSTLSFSFKVSLDKLDIYLKISKFNLHATNLNMQIPFEAILINITLIKAMRKRQLNIWQINTEHISKVIITDAINLFPAKIISE